MKIILPLLLVPLASSLKPFDDHHVEIVQVSTGNIAGHLIVQVSKGKSKEFFLGRQVKACLNMYNSRKQILLKVSNIAQIAKAAHTHKQLEFF